MKEQVLKSKTIGFIGAGNMAQALISGLVASKQVQAEQIFVFDIDSQRLKSICKDLRVTSTSGNHELAEKAEILILAVKPQQVEGALEKMQLRSDHLLISIAAGTTTQKLEKLTASKPKIVRVMPNTPALHRQGITAIFIGPRSGEKEAKIAEAIFNAVGKTVRIDSESLMDAVTALSGSGPAYFFHLAELMVEAGIELGLDSKTATELVLQTLQGSASLAVSSQRPLAELRKQVTSPGGTTEAALRIFESRDLRGMVKEAVRRAFERSRELS
ncbi:MAG: pyrroline-5-carboxylate reductase [Deltaproteobacteria bacterium]|nr:pyrroline-5-carboxylate reductase [Deltaproteobacteria bacterium]